MTNKIGGGKIKSSAGAFAATIVIGMSLAGLNASAQSETFNGTIDASTLDNNVTTTLPEFNSALGTLTGVQITLDFQVTPYAQAVNTTFNANTFTSLDYAYTTFPASPNTPWTISLGTDSWNLAQPTVSTGDIFGTGQSVPSFTGLTFVGGTSVAADLTGASGLDFSAYIGGGDLVFGTSGTGTYGGSGTGFGFGGGADLAGTASVTYDFTPAPEPTTLALAGLGGLSLLLFRRQRK